MLDRIRQTIERYSMFRPGMTVGVAVSGGADSVCLLHVLGELDLRLHVLHLNHNLRGEESCVDAEFVRQLAARLGVPYTIREADFSKTAGNLEQAARDARLALFRQTIADGVVERVAVGHTRSDQAETVLFRFLRGSGTAGLAAIRPVTADGIVRPLLEIDREEIRLYLRDRSIAWREDASNSAGQFARNRIRHQLLPQLQHEWNPALGEILAHTAEWAQAEEAYWDEELTTIWPSLAREQNGFVLFSCPALVRLPLAFRRRVVRRAIEHARGGLRGVDFRHVAGILEIASGQAGHGCLQIPGLEVLRSFDWLRFAPPGRQTAGYRLPVSIPCQLHIPGYKLALCLELIEKPETSESSVYVYNEGMGSLEWPRLSTSLAVRNWQPGDRYRPAGSTGELKLKTLFHHARIPVWERGHWPVLVDGESIVWTRQFGAAAGFAANSGSRSILRIREVESH